MRGVLAVLSLLLVSVGVAVAEPPKPEVFDNTGFEPVFNGKDLTGWTVSAKSGHSRTSKNMSGGKWVVEDGAITGCQDVPGNGGIIHTNKKYGNFEIVLEMKNDDGPDSGLFLRSDDKGKCYQAMIDYHKDGNLMGIYGEGMGGKPHVRNFNFGKNVTEIVAIDKAKQDDNGFALPVKPEEWKAFWNPQEWNELRVRMTSNPPTLTTWIKGVKFMHYVDKEKRLPDDGFVALQVHGGGDWTKKFVRYRNIKIKELK